MSMKRVKRIFIVCLALGMLIISTVLMSSAKTSSRTYTAGGGSFKATLTSDTNGVSRTVVTNSFATSNHTTGVSLTKSQKMSGYYGYGYLNSLSYQGSNIPLASVPQLLGYHYFTSPVNATTTWINYSNGVPY